MPHPGLATIGLIRALALSHRQLLQLQTDAYTSADSYRRGSNKGQSTSEHPLHIRSISAYISTRAIQLTSALSTNIQLSKIGSSGGELAPMTTPLR